MSYTSLTGAKNSAGSLMNWVNYSRLDTATVLDEAQSLLYQILRVREMRTEWTFGMAVGQANQPLPARFLDPIGKIFDITNVTDYGHVIESEILRNRSYDTSLSGSFGSSPFTTTSGSSHVSAALTAHGFTQDSTITIAGASAVNSITMNGSFPVITITDASNLIVDTGDTLASASGAGGGASATYTGNKLVSGSPSRWSVWDEEVKFDVAVDTAAVMKLLYYRRPILLSAANLTNFLTDRYPKLLRVACMAAAADFMKDDVEYKKNIEALNNLVGATAAENDMIYRGSTFGTDTPR